MLTFVFYVRMYVGFVLLLYSIVPVALWISVGLYVGLQESKHCLCAKIISKQVLHKGSSELFIHNFSH